MVTRQTEATGSIGEVNGSSPCLEEISSQGRGLGAKVAKGLGFAKRSLQHSGESLGGESHTDLTFAV